ncbi:hypothetical protein BUZ67_09465 [Staphylococcus pasteuri]|uniref:hypothetical protein n=1 Tax=Staphylococcus pasteuri TaxID=45972 RepID=UPI000D3908EF|nr:hypothetical protein [Staphylococcus pasteuri]PTU84001.1 hypothetical protein BUZ67_09465 [Staphylococcus pasteuri]
MIQHIYTVTNNIGFIFLAIAIGFGITLGIFWRLHNKTTDYDFKRTENFYKFLIPMIISLLMAIVFWLLAHILVI